MKRKIRLKDKAYNPDGVDFKLGLIQDILNQIDYQMAYRHEVVTVSESDMIRELEKLSTHTLAAWYQAYLYIRRGLMFAGYELNGFKVLDMPLDTIHELMEKDPTFDIKQYIF